MPYCSGVLAAAMLRQPSSMAGCVSESPVAKTEEDRMEREIAQCVDIEGSCLDCRGWQDLLFQLALLRPKTALTTIDNGIEHVPTAGNAWPQSKAFPFKDPLPVVTRRSLRTWSGRRHERSRRRRRGKSKRRSRRSRIRKPSERLGNAQEWRST